MMKKMTLLLFFAFMFVAHTSLFGQDRRISKRDVSGDVRNFIALHYPQSKRCKFYKEDEDGLEFIECEFKLKGKDYSLKFLADSIIETEITLEFDSLPIQHQQGILTVLDSLFSNYDLLKCEELFPQKARRYEINIRTKTNHFFELYFNDVGQLVERKEVFIKPIPSQF